MRLIGKRFGVDYMRMRGESVAAGSTTGDASHPAPLANSTHSPAVIETACNGM